MRKVVLFLMFGFSTVTYGLEPGVLTRSAQKSFLSAQKFPTVYQDLSFVDRMANEAAGYEPWESEYDDNGRCIKNCAYDGITIEDELSAAQSNTDAARQELQSTVFNYGTPQTSLNKIAPSAVSVSNVPVIEPVANQPRISSPFGERVHPVTGKRHVHRGIDYAVPSGTNVFAPANGTVTSVWQDKTCGNGLKIKHDMGYETVYCHLNDIIAQQGATVTVGTIVAHSGNTGRSTGAHLHYGIKKDGNYINPSGLTGR